MSEREITVMRKKTLLNNATDWFIQIDGRDCGIIHGGEVKRIRLDETRHTLLVYANDPNIGKVDEVLIPEGSGDYAFHVSLSAAWMGTISQKRLTVAQSCIKIKQL